MKTIEELEKELATANKLINELAEKDEAKCKIRIIHIAYSCLDARGIPKLSCIHLPSL
jgi:hypothetical protein